MGFLISSSRVARPDSSVRVCGGLPTDKRFEPAFKRLSDAGQSRDDVGEGALGFGSYIRGKLLGPFDLAELGQMDWWSLWILVNAGLALSSMKPGK
jgi:hypothetical protein